MTANLWDDAEALRYVGDLGQRVYTSRLLGRDPALVLHGGGNTSVKITEPDIFGNGVSVLYVKGSGWDLATIEPAGYSPVRLEALLALAGLDTLSDTEMARQLRLATIDPAAPDPSVEAILHALIPHRYVDHTHPDALIAVMNTPSGEERVRSIYGPDVLIVPYVMPGFQLAVACRSVLERHSGDGTIGIVLMHHGLFSFGATARESYERMIGLVTRAEDHLRAHAAWDVDPGLAPSETASRRVEVAELRHGISRTAGRPMIVRASDAPSAAAFARRDDLGRVALSGPATPDHVIRTKRVPMIGRDVDGYASAYEAYVVANRSEVESTIVPLDPAPRIVLDPELGLVAAGETPRGARIAEEIYLHTIDIISRAERLERWEALPPSSVFQVEYWELEQAKLRRSRQPLRFAGEVALVTGSASGIGRACAEQFLQEGAAVVGLDVDPAVESAHDLDAYLGIVCDVTDPGDVDSALEAGVRTFGGLDVLVLNAGLFPPGAPVSSPSLEGWRRTLEVNLEANVRLLAETHPLLALSPRGGRVVVNASKNVPAPGPGASAYSASKAALTQLARVTALEWAADRIRVNIVHPNAVFDTGLWTDEVIAERAVSYGMSPNEYRAKNLLGVEVTSRDVAGMIVEMSGDAFSRTTGAQVPVDGGNERVI